MGWRLAARLVAGILGLASFGRAEAAALPPNCSPATPAACAYVSDINVPFAGPVDKTLIDTARNNYNLLIRVRYPSVMVGKRPIIIWNHGGEPKATGRTVSQEWSEAFASAGYIVIHPSRTPITNVAPFRATCTQNGVNGPTQLTFDAACAQFVAHALYGPQNMEFILQNLTKIQALIPALNGHMDPTRVLIGGWSAGTTIGLANSGAWRQFKPGGPVHHQTNLHPLGFMAVAPFGADYAGFTYTPRWDYGGFQSTSFDAVDTRPFLFVTGKGDLDGQKNPPEARTAAFLRAKTGHKFLAWSTVPQPSHATMNISDCGLPGSMKDKHCDWIRSLGLAFVDTVLRGRTEAITWMNSDAFTTMTGNVMELHRR